MLVTIVVGVWLYHPIFNFLRHPYCELPPTRRAGGTSCDLIFPHPTDAFFVRMRVSLIVGVLFSAPIWLYELWAFITPGLHRQRAALDPRVPRRPPRCFSRPARRWRTCCLHTALNFLLGFGGNGIKSLLTVTDYLSFVTHLLIVFGASFLFPLVIILLNLAGILSAKRLASWRRVEIFLCFVFAGFVTPSGRPVHHARARHRALPVLRGRDPVREVERSPPRPPRRACRSSPTSPTPRPRRRHAVRSKRRRRHRAAAPGRAAARASVSAGLGEDDIT